METGETLFFIAIGMRSLACEKNREILEISQKCYFFIHFPILELRLCHAHSGANLSAEGGRTLPV